MGLERPIIVGGIDYANAWPLFYGLETYPPGHPYELVSKVPSKLNALLRQGELDVSAISSFSYGQYSSQYVLLPGLSVGTAGKVHSILLFLKEPIDTIKPRRIAVTTTSETSVNLLKIIMTMRYECEPEYVSAEPDLDAMLADSDAALLIGDPAIQASWRNTCYQVMDLGEQWNSWTGLGMTYAVVAAAKGAATEAKDAILSVYAALRDNMNRNCGNPEPLVSLACERIGGSPAYWHTYFRTLQYDFGPKLQEGLRLYFRYAKELGLLRHDVRLDFMEEQSPQKVKE